MYNELSRKKLLYRDLSTSTEQLCLKRRAKQFFLLLIQQLYRILFIAQDAKEDKHHN